MVVLEHYAGTLNTEFSDIALLNLIAVLVDDLTLPAVARNSDGTYLVCILKSEVNAARAGRLGKTVVGVVLVIREVIPLVTDK